MARLKNEFEFIAGMHHDGQMYFNRYRLLIDFYTNTDSTEDQNIAVERMTMLIYEFVQNSVFVNENDVEAIRKYAKADISVLTVPSPGPFDPVVLAVLAVKLNAIMEDTLVITDAELTSQLGGFLTYIWDSADNEDEIHDIVSEDEEHQWWASPAPRFISYPEDTDVEEFEEEHPLQLSWEALNLGWHQEDLDADNEDEDTSSTVVRISDFTNPKKDK